MRTDQTAAPTAFKPDPGTYGYGTTTSDALDSVRALTDSSKANAITYTYAPYGESTATVTDSDANSNRYRFTSREYETAFMNFYRSRYYANRMGRFYSKDRFPSNSKRPISIHRYLYTEGNPINYHDPLGFSLDPGPLMPYYQGNCPSGCSEINENVCDCPSDPYCHGYDNETGLPYGASLITYFDWVAIMGLIPNLAGGLDFLWDWLWGWGFSSAGFTTVRRCPNLTENYTHSAPYWNEWANKDVSPGIHLQTFLTAWWRISVQGCVYAFKQQSSPPYEKTWLIWSCSPGIFQESFSFDPGYSYSFETTVPSSLYWNQSKVEFWVQPADYWGGSNIFSIRQNLTPSQPDTIIDNLGQVQNCLN